MALASRPAELSEPVVSPPDARFRPHRSQPLAPPYRKMGPFQGSMSVYSFACGEPARLSSPRQQFFDPGDARVAVMLHLVLPEAADRPSSPPEPPEVPGVPQAVRLDRGLPCLGQLVPPDGKPPPVPEMPVHEDGHHGDAEQDVRAAEQVLGVSLELPASGCQCFRDGPFRPCILAIDSGDERTALVGENDIARVSAG